MAQYPFFTPSLKTNFCIDMELNFESKLLCLDDLSSIGKGNINLIIRCVEKCCSTINPDYLAASINKLRTKVSRTRSKRDYKFDIAIIFNHTSDELEAMTDEDMISSTEAILIVEKGECQMFPDAFSINLICSDSGKGKYLIAFFIYCIINNSYVIDKKGVLELASGYLNIAGLCLYSKYGFEHDPRMYGDHCFGDVNNLPMIVNTNNYYRGPNIKKSKVVLEEKNTTLKNILMNNEPYFLKPDICNIRDTNLQILTGLILNLKNYRNYLSSPISDADIASHGRVKYIMLDKLVGPNIDLYINNLPYMAPDEVYIILKKILPDHKSKLIPPTSMTSSTTAILPPTTTRTKRGRSQTPSATITTSTKRTRRSSSRPKRSNSRSGGYKLKRKLKKVSRKISKK
jgi:hypothetical protein